VIKKHLPRPVKKLAKKLLFPIPVHISKNIRKINNSQLISIEKSIKENYFVGWRDATNYSEAEYGNYLKEQISGRLESDRREVIPWLDNAFALDNKSILEVGCGTGSSTIALAEQGAKVTGIDIDSNALTVAEDRGKIYGLKADFQLLNAQEIASNFCQKEFDIIIFFACLEHMTVSERLAALAGAWEILPPDGFLVVVETPNRLWYYDSHTSKLPFFHWLPDELAISYTKFSPAENLHKLYKNHEMKAEEHFLRRGRGVSFHEFDLAIGNTAKLNIISSLSSFEGIKYKLRTTRWNRTYKSFLMKVCPDIHEGFFDDLLYLIIRKS